MSRREYTAVFAVVRYDRYLDGFEPENCITVKEILPTLDEAEQEVARLNALREGGESIYFVQRTRYYPEGRDVEPGS